MEERRAKLAETGGAWDDKPVRVPDILPQSLWRLNGHPG